MPLSPSREAEIRARHTALCASCEEIAEGLEQADSLDISDEFHGNALTDMGDLLAALDAERERVARLEAIVREYIYETTHLSPKNDDGSHWCKISVETLGKARNAINDTTDESVDRFLDRSLRSLERLQSIFELEIFELADVIAEFDRMTKPHRPS